MTVAASLLNYAIQNQLILDVSNYEMSRPGDVPSVGVTVIHPGQDGYSIPQEHFTINSVPFENFPITTNNYRSIRKFIEDLGPRYSGYKRALNSQIPAGVDPEWLYGFEDVSHPIDISFLEMMAPKPLVRAPLSDREVIALFAGSEAEFEPEGASTENGIPYRYPVNFDLPEFALDERYIAESAFKFMEKDFNMTLRRRFHYLLATNRDNYLYNIVSSPDLLRQLIRRYFPVDSALISNDNSKEYSIEAVRHIVSNLIYAMEIVRHDSVMVQLGEDMIDAVARGLITVDDWNNEDNRDILRRYQERRDAR
jgi:hypothetical protein